MLMGRFLPLLERARLLGDGNRATEAVESAARDCCVGTGPFLTNTVALVILRLGQLLNKAFEDFLLSCRIAAGRF